MVDEPETSAGNERAAFVRSMWFSELLERTAGPLRLPSTGYIVRLKKMQDDNDFRSLKPGADGNDRDTSWSDSGQDSKLIVPRVQSERCYP